MKQLWPELLGLLLDHRKAVLTIIANNLRLMVQSLKAVGQNDTHRTIVTIDYNHGPTPFIDSA